MRSIFLIFKMSFYLLFLNKHAQKPGNASTMIRSSGVPQRLTTQSTHEPVHKIWPRWQTDSKLVLIILFPGKESQQDAHSEAPVDTRSLNTKEYFTKIVRSCIVNFRFILVRHLAGLSSALIFSESSYLKLGIKQSKIG